MRISDWSSDVCSSDLLNPLLFRAATDHGHHLNLTAVRYLVEGQHRHIRQMLAQELEQRPAHERSEEHTSELQSLMRISYAVFCLKKKKKNTKESNDTNHTNRSKLK